jgi:hypothetical protein
MTVNGVARILKPSELPSNHRLVKGIEVWFLDSGPEENQIFSYGRLIYRRMLTHYVCLCPPSPK